MFGGGHLTGECRGVIDRPEVGAPNVAAWPSRPPGGDIEEGHSTMPYFRALGALPAKRSTLFSNNGSGYYYEELVGEDGFGSDLSHAYHVNPPTAIVAATRVDHEAPELIE